MFQVKKEGSKQNVMVSDFTKMFARQISKVQLHRRRLQSKVRKTLKLVYNVKSVTTSTLTSLRQTGDFRSVLLCIFLFSENLGFSPLQDFCCWTCECSKHLRKCK